MKLFLHPRSPLFIAIFLLTIALCYININSTPPSSFVIRPSSLVYVLALTLILFAAIPWYGLKYKGYGIEEHYENMLLPTVYLLLLHETLFALDLGSVVFSVLVCVVFLVLLAINIFLLTLHFRDHDKTPPAYFARELYLKDDQ